MDDQTRFQDNNYLEVLLKNPSHMSSMTGKGVGKVMIKLG